MAGAQGYPLSSAVCPFCKGSVPAELARLGGNCPHCMLEIPGEDAPTDPGAALRAKQAVEDQRQAAAASRRRRMGLAAAAVAGFCFVAGVGAWWWRQEQATVYELDDFYIVPIEDLAAAPAAAGAPEAAPSKATAPRTKPGARPTAGTTNTSTASSASAPTAGGAASPSGAGMTSPGDFTISTSGGPGSVSIGGGAAIDVSRPDLVLENEDEIYAMVKTVIQRSSPQLTHCYEQRLKQLPDLAGAWKVEFTITKAGTASGVDVAAQGRADGELESCIARAIGGWRFARIAHDQPVAKTYRFKPSGG